MLRMETADRVKKKKKKKVRDEWREVKKKKINSKSVERMKTQKEDTDIGRKEFKKLRKQNG